MKREQEQAYLILHDDLSSVAKEFAERESLGGIPLGANVVHEIEDTYFDTPEDDLRMSTVTLRTRILDGDLYVTFKGKEKADSDFTQDHGELEFLWPIPDTDPTVIADAAGLVQVQKRNTKRLSRMIEYPDGTPIAEACFDNSLYTVSTGQARIYEFEVERQGTMKLKNLLPIIEADMPYLSRWNHGKFVTGKALEFAFGIKTDENSNVTLDSFPYIEQMFRQLKITK